MNQWGGGGGGVENGGIRERDETETPIEIVAPGLFLKKKMAGAPPCLAVVTYA